MYGYRAAQFYWSTRLAAGDCSGGRPGLVLGGGGLLDITQGTMPFWVVNWAIARISQAQERYASVSYKFRVECLISAIFTKGLERSSKVY